MRDTYLKARKCLVQSERTKELLNRSFLYLIFICFYIRAIIGNKSIKSINRGINSRLALYSLIIKHVFLRNFISTMPESLFQYQISIRNSTHVHISTSKFIKLKCRKFTFDIQNSWKSFEVKCLMIVRDLDKLLHTIRSCYLQYTNHCVIACDYVDAILSRMLHCVFEMNFLDIFGVCYVTVVRLKIHTHAHVTVLLLCLMSG